MAKVKPKTKARKRVVKRSSTSTSTRKKTKVAGVDPRVIAAVGLALHDEAVAAGRDEQLRGEASQWTVLARARGMRAR